MLARDLPGLAGLAARLERARARRDEILLFDGVDHAELGPKLLGLCEPLLRGLRTPEHRERPGAMLRELVAQHRMVDVAEDDERLVDGVQRLERAFRRDLDDREDVVRVGVAPPRRDFARDLERLQRVVTALVEATDAPEGDGEVAVRRHGRGPAGRRAIERRRVVLRRRARVGQAHRQVAERHRHRRRARRRLRAARRRARRGEAPGSRSRLDRASRRAAPARGGCRAARAAPCPSEPPPGRATRAEARPRRGRRARRWSRGWRARSPSAPASSGFHDARRARERRRKVARPVDAPGLAVGAKEADGQRRVGPGPARHRVLDPRRDERRLVGGGEAIEELRARGDRDVLERRQGRRRNRAARVRKGTGPWRDRRDRGPCRWRAGTRADRCTRPRRRRQTSRATGPRGGLVVGP